MPSIRLAVVDAHDLTRHGIQMMLSHTTPPIEVVGVYPDLLSCEAALKTVRPHILLLDDTLPRTKDVPSVIAELHEQHPGLNIIILSSRLSGRYVQKLLTDGAKGFIYKEDRMPDTLVAGIETVRSGSFYVSPKASALPYLGEAHLDSGDLKPSDLRVLALLAEGCNVQEIADLLGMVDRSIYRIRARLKAALNVRNNEQIVDAARKKGLLSNPGE